MGCGGHRDRPRSRAWAGRTVDFPLGCSLWSIPAVVRSYRALTCGDKNGGRTVSNSARPGDTGPDGAASPDLPRHYGGKGGLSRDRHAWQTGSSPPSAAPRKTATVREPGGPPLELGYSPPIDAVRSTKRGSEARKNIGRGAGRERELDLG